MRFTNKIRGEVDDLAGLLLFIFILGFLAGKCQCTCRPARAECVTHTVQTGETLGQISKHYYNKRNYWKDIKWQNNLQRNTLEVGQKLYIYVPNEDDWPCACSYILAKRLEQLKLIRGEEFSLALLNGIYTASIDHLEYSPLEKLEACRWTITTAEQESMFQFAIGGAGEVGIYQFKLDTVRLTAEWYGSTTIAEADDKTIVKMLLDPRTATTIFVLHYAELYKRYHNKWNAWKRYNNGSDAAAYASKAMERYWRVRRIVPFKCHKGE